MKKKIIFIFLACIIITFGIYLSINNNKINYLSLGDGIALGINPYNQKDYGYNLYLKDYLKTQKKLNNYMEFSKEDLRVKDLIDMIEDDYSIKINKKNVSINEAINNADVITISLGSTEVYNKLKLNNIKYLYTEINDIYGYIDNFINEYEESLKLIKKLYKKENLILIGVYNPVVNSSYINNEELLKIFDYLDNRMQTLAKKYQAKYINTNKIIKREERYFSNPNSIHINKKGYENIYKEILKKTEFYSKFPF